MVILFNHYRLAVSYVLWIDRPMHRTDLFIVNGADLENTKINIEHVMLNEL